jgi:hypothetical protein
MTSAFCQWHDSISRPPTDKRSPRRLAGRGLRLRTTWRQNGRNNFRTVEEIVNSALAPGMTDAEKAFAIWFQEIQYRHHASGDNNDLGDPVKYHGALMTTPTYENVPYLIATWFVPLGPWETSLRE